MSGSDNNVGSKTADEMFLELGYKEDFPNEPKGCVLYSRSIPADEYIGCEEKVEIKLWTEDKFVTSSLVDVGILEHYERDLNFSEILACAQLIREMGCAE